MDPAPRLIHADSEKCADMLYAAGLFVPDPFSFLQEGDGTTHLIISPLEVDRARRSARVTRVHDSDILHKQYETQGKPNPQAVLLARFMGERGISLVQVPDDFPLGLAETLRGEGITVTPVNGPFWPQRARKSELEVNHIREALRITGLGMNAGIELIRRASIHQDGFLHYDGEPLTSERVRGEINATLVRLGAMPAHTIVSGGKQAADPHEEGHGPLPAHQAIILDVFPRVEKTGYFGDMTRTVCKGNPSTRVQAAWAAVLRGQEKAFSMIRAGVSGKAVHDAVTALLSEAGFVTGPTASGQQGGFFHGTGHGLGLEIHEAPRVSRVDSTLQSGHVVTVEPGLYYPDMGGVRLEDVVVVREDGCENLTDVPKFFVLD